MTPDENKQLATSCWEECQANLPPEIVMLPLKRDPGPISKSGYARIRLRVRPKRKSPSRFWGGWTWYEINVGHMPSPEVGLNLGNVAFIQSPSQKASGGGAYERPTIEILRKAQQALGEHFRLFPADKLGAVTSLKRTYPANLKSFPSNLAGKDMARLISATLPLIMRLPNAVI